MKFCGYCGTSAEDEFAFCPKCGKKFPPEQQCCPSCNKELPNDSSFCPYCGTQIQQSIINNVSSQSNASYGNNVNEQSQNKGTVPLSTLARALINYGKSHMMNDYNWVRFGYEGVPKGRGSINSFIFSNKLKKENFLFRELLGMAIGIGIDQMSQKLEFDRGKLIIAVAYTIFSDNEMIDILCLEDVNTKQDFINLITDYAHYTELPYDVFSRHAIISLAIPANDDFIENGKFLETNLKVDFIKMRSKILEKVDTVIDDL